MVPLNGVTNWLVKHTVGDPFGAACQALFNGVVTLLQWAFKVMGAIGTVDVNPNEGHPLGQVYPIMLWIGAALALACGLFSAARIAVTQGRTTPEVLGGFVKFALAWVGALSIVALLVTMADELATGILGAGKVENFGAVGEHVGWLSAAQGKDVSPVLALLVALLFLLPAAVGFLLFAVVRAAGIEIIAATIPILTAGLLWNRTSKWLGMACQWLLVLIFLPVMLAITVLIGISMMAGVGSQGGLAGLGQLLVGSVTLALSLASPVILLKLFSFVPASVAGQMDGVRGLGGLGGFGGSRGHGSSSGGVPDGRQVAEQGTMARIQAAQNTMTGAGESGAAALESVGVGHQTGVAARAGAAQQGGASAQGQGGSSTQGQAGEGEASSTSAPSTPDVGSPAEPEAGSSAPSGGGTTAGGAGSTPSGGTSTGGASAPATVPNAPASAPATEAPGASAPEAGRPAESAGSSSTPEGSWSAPVEGPMHGPVAPPSSSAPDVGQPAGGGQPGAGAAGGGAAGGGAAAGGAEAAAVIV